MAEGDRGRPAADAYPADACAVVALWCEALAQEPWCFDPDKIARLTDHQILKQYLEPAVKRAEEFARDNPAPGPGKPLGTRRKPAGGSGPDYEPGTEGHRRQIEGAFMSMMGMSPEKAKALYDKQLAQWKAEQNGRA